jgi:hypothetical protein
MSSSWQNYVTTLCEDAWDLDALATTRVVRGIEALVDTDGLSDPAVVDVLSDVGVAASFAGLFAPSICATVTGSVRRRAPTPPPAPFWHPRHAEILQPCP